MPTVSLGMPMKATWFVSGSMLTTMSVSVSEPLVPTSRMFRRPLVQSACGTGVAVGSGVGVGDAPGARLAGGAVGRGAMNDSRGVDRVGWAVRSVTGDGVEGVVHRVHRLGDRRVADQQHRDDGEQPHGRAEATDSRVMDALRGTCDPERVEDGDEPPEQVDGDAREQVLLPGGVGELLPEVLEAHRERGAGDERHGQQPGHHEERAAAPVDRRRSGRDPAAGTRGKPLRTRYDAPAVPRWGSASRAIVSARPANRRRRPVRDRRSSILGAS